ncbi:PTP type protein phosphatase [Trinorchestia longiramus]|nr:PTP type protein phosphatase [Trinorchestia longiramus]
MGARNIVLWAAALTLCSLTSGTLDQLSPPENRATDSLTTRALQPRVIEGANLRSDGPATISSKMTSPMAPPGENKTYALTVSETPTTPRLTTATPTTPASTSRTPTIPLSTSKPTVSVFTSTTLTVTASTSTTPTVSASTSRTPTTPASTASTEATTSACATPLDDLKANSTSSESVTLSWTAPAASCEILYYNISFTGYKLWGDDDSLPEFTDTYNNSDIDSLVQIEVTELEPYSHYDFQVVAVSGVLEDTSANASAETLQAPPSEPQNVVAHSLSPTSIDVSWEKPVEENGILKKYYISWSNGGDEVLSTEVDDTQYTITSLTSCVEYNIRVEAQTDAGYGDASNTSTTTAAEAPPEVTGLVNTSVSSSSISLSWNRPETKCEITYYTVIYGGQVLWSEQQIENETITVENNDEKIETEITGLTPYSEYNIEVVASTAGGDGPSSEPLVTTTDQDAPSEPQNVVAQSSSPTSIDVSWEKPVEENGILKKYYISWSNGGDDVLSADVDDTQYTITSLTSCVEYNISVEAQTDAGYGDASNTSTTTAVEAPPEVTSLKATSVSSRSITLSWGRPDTECEITNYTVIYAGLVLWDQGRFTGNQSTDYPGSFDEVEMEIGDLVPYTTYNMTVVAATDAGSGKSSTLWNQQTDEDVPSAARDVTTESQSPTSIQVSWVPPEEKNGVLLDYLVVWSSDSQSERSANVSSSSENYFIDDLVACVLYNIVVLAQTSAGYGNETYSSTTTQTEVPPVVTDVRSTSVSSSSIDLSWNKPATACHITQYVVKYEGEVLWDEQRTYNESFFNSKDEDRFDAQIVDLIPFTEYMIIVGAETGAGPGDYSLPLNTTTLEDAPSAPIITSIQPKHKTLGVSWHDPEILNGVLIQYSVTLYRGSSLVKEHNVSAQASHTTFEDLEYQTSYNVTLEAWTGGGVGRSSSMGTTVASPAPAIAGTIVGLLIIILIVVLAYIKRNDVKKIMEKWKDPPPHQTQATSMASSPSPPTPQNEGAKLWRRIAILQQDEGALLAQEFSNIQGNSYAGTTEAAAVNSTKNRFINILAYDNHRVLLGENKDYINANYIKNYDQSDYLIAAQGPMPSTIGDWWQMILEQKATFVIMLTNCVEKGKRKCHQYWPTLENWLEASASLYIYNSKEVEHNGYVIRNLCITDPSGYALLHVKQYHFTAWPDFGVPEDPAALLTFISDIKVDQSGNPLPSNSHMVVHCSAGVGRTGTFISVWNLCHLYKANGEISDVPKEVLAMRERRTNMVQTKDQLLFVYRCYAEYVSRPGHWNIPDSWEMCRAREFEEIDQRSLMYSSTVAQREENKLKNCTSNVLPYDHSIVKLQNPPGYINASFVKDHSEKQTFIAAQDPMKNTVQDWWQMVLEQNVAVLVMLTNCIEGGQKCVRYWPNGNEAIPLSGGRTVVKVEEENRGNFIIRTFKIEPQKGGRARKTVVQFDFKAWQGFHISGSASHLLELLSAVKTAVVRSHPGPDSHVVVHCSDGVSRTGTFIAVWNLCHKFKKDGRVLDVKREILSLRDYRTKLVPTEDQYMHVYNCYIEFMKSPEHWPLPDLEPEASLYENIEIQPANSDAQIYANGTTLHDRTSPSSKSTSLKMTNLRP